MWYNRSNNVVYGCYLSFCGATYLEHRLYRIALQSTAEHSAGVAGEGDLRIIRSSRGRSDHFHLP